jgi:hypothetical protein
MLNPVNWPRLPSVAAAVNQAMQTDLSPLDAVAIAAAVLRDPGEPDRLVVDQTLVNPIVGQGGAFLLEPRADLKPAVARFLGGSVSASVEVLNGAGVAGLARTTADKLAQRGFVIANVGDAPRTQSQTSILARPGALRAAEQVAVALGLPTSRVTESASLSAAADVQVTLGTDAR